MSPPGADVLLVDDHPLVLDGLRARLQHHPAIGRLAEASSGEEALEKIRYAAPDVAVLDISMPGLNGLEVTRIVRREHPQVRVLILSMHSHSMYVRQAVEAGAHGYVLKCAPSSELVAAIEAVVHGRSFLPASQPDASSSGQEVAGEGPGPEPAILTRREGQVLAWVAAGLSSKQIADQLLIAPRTVEKHREHIMRKLGIHCAVELARYALAAVTPPGEA